MEKQIIEIRFLDKEFIKNNERQLQRGKIEISLKNIHKIYIYLKLHRIGINTKHIKIYKKRIAKIPKNQTWEKSAINSFNLFKKFSKKDIQDYFLQLNFREKEFDRLLKKKLPKELKQKKVSISVAHNQKHQCPMKPIPRENYMKI